MNTPRQAREERGSGSPSRFRAPRDAERREETSAQPSPTLKEGHVKWYNQKKGFGFVVSKDGEDILFNAVHLEALGVDAISEGAPVRYDDFEVQRGKYAGKRRVTHLARP